MTNDTLWLTEQDVVTLMTLPMAIGALQSSVLLEHDGQARNMEKTMVQYGHSNLHALGGQLGSVVGTKSWVHAEAGTCPLLLLWDAIDGHLLAVIEAFALGNLRTGATSGLATQWLAAQDAHTMAVMGCGKQALSQVAAVVAVRPITRVLAYDRTLAHAQSFAQTVRERLGIETEPFDTVEAATADADVVTTVTSATEPFLFGRQLKDGTHLNAIGAIGPDREEFGQDVFVRAHIVCVDHLSGVQKLSREFGRRYSGDGWNVVQPLGVLAARGAPAWKPSGVTLFKAMGMGLSDVALGATVLERARAAGIGHTLPQPRKAVPNLRPAPAQAAA